jgi:hypothetical protein
VRGIREAGPWHPEEDDTSWIRLQRAHIPLQRLRLLLLVAVLGLGVLLGQVTQELPRPPPVNRIVFDDGLLLSALTATGTLRIQGLGCLPLLVPSEALGAGPAPFPAVISLCGPRPPDINLGTTLHPLTGEHGVNGWTPLHSHDERRTGLERTVMSSKTGI